MKASAERVGRGQFFLLRVEGDERVWHTRQFAFKQRKGEPLMIPYWFEEGKAWHVWVGAEETEVPPLASFGSMSEAKEYVEGLAAG
ncbi:hypothetical protein [Streptomyces sp. NPDC059278]|uniref:hypothetical protein n=1 Tax=Streptomyces sp. NPDC059278 TaxID=3346801 RepID=UPI00369F223C